MIVFRSDTPPSQPASPDQAHHNERLTEYHYNLHMHNEARIAAGEDPQAVEAELVERVVRGRQMKEEWMRRFYGTKNVSANALLRRISVTTLR